MPKIFKVSQVVQEVKWLLEDAYGAVAVEGEVSEATRSQRGHLYFTLKDDQAELKCVMWSSAASRLPFKLETGRVFICFGGLTLYAARGTFQMEVRKIEPRGIGTLQLALEQLTKKLEAEGLFAQERKKPLPPVPQRVGVITSPEGAALQDFLKILEEAPFPVHVRLFPAQVQGKGAAAEVARGVQYFQAHPPDVIVITRGGGSFEDLMPFNEEFLVRRIARCAVPVISAVGHEVDITLCDRAADLRVPTPTAAAQIIVGLLQGVSDRLAESGQRLAAAMRGICAQREVVLQAHKAKVSPRALKAFQQGMRERLHAFAVALRGGAMDSLRWRREALGGRRISLFRQAYLLAPRMGEKVRICALRLEGIRPALARRGEKVAFLRQSLHHLNVRGTLKRGYAILRKGNQAVIRSKGDVQPLESIEALLYDGRLVCRVQEKKRE
jgi:exodeoxyribonuclease VII large subunit